MKTIFTILFLTFGLTLAGENDLASFNEARNTLNKNGMLVLGSWALANIATGGIQTFQEEGSRKFFYQMNAAWNVVNLAIAGFGYYGAVSADTALTLYKSISAQQSIESILLFNAGLDLAYMAGGAWLIEKARGNKRHDRLKGYGQSIILQGGFLLVFDAALYWMHRSNHYQLRQILESITFDGQQLGIRLLF